MILIHNDIVTTHLHGKQMLSAMIGEWIVCNSLPQILFFVRPFFSQAAFSGKRKVSVYSQPCTARVLQSCCHPQAKFGGGQLLFSEADLSVSLSLPSVPVCSSFSVLEEEVEEEASGVGAAAVGVAVGVGVATVSEL